MVDRSIPTRFLLDLLSPDRDPRLFTCILVCSAADLDRFALTPIHCRLCPDLHIPCHLLITALATLALQHFVSLSHPHLCLRLSRMTLVP